MDDRLIEILERIAKSQEELVKLNEQKNIKEHAAALIKYCQEHNDSCDGCPLNDPEYDQCMIKSVCCPAELCLF